MSTARGGMFVLQALQNFILAGLLGPKGFGEVSLFNLIFQYARLAGFGIDRVAYREIPGRMAVNDIERVETVKNMAFTCEMWLRVLVCLLVLIMGLVFYSGMIRTGIIIIVLVLFVDKMNELYYGIGSALKKFSILSKGNLISGFIMALLTISLVKFTGIYTQLIAMFFVTSLVIFYYNKKLKLDIKPLFVRKEFFLMLKMGIPFVFMAIAFTIWQISGRTMTAISLDMTALGLYSFAHSCVLILVMFLDDFQTAFQPIVYERMAKTKNKRDIFAVVRKPALLFGYTTPIVIAFLFLIFPFFVRWFMPRYENSIWIFRILLANVYLAYLGIMVNYLLRSAELNKQSYLLFSYSLAAGVSYLSMWVLLKIGLGVTGVVIGVIMGQAVAVVQTFIMAHRYYIDGWKEAIAYYRELITPLPVLVGFSTIVLWIEQIEYFNGFVKASIAFALLFLLSGFLLYMLNNKTGIVIELLKMVDISGKRNA